MAKSHPTINCRSPVLLTPGGGKYAIKINKDQTLLLLPHAKIYLFWVHHVIDYTEYVCIKIVVYNSCLKAYLGSAFLSKDKYDSNDTSS